MEKIMPFEQLVVFTFETSAGSVEFKCQHCNSDPKNGKVEPNRHSE